MHLSQFHNVALTSWFFKINLGSFEQEALQAHNNYRSIHDAPPMTLDSSMSQSAAAYAQRLARMGTLQHSSSSEKPGQGENLAMACGSGGLSAKKAVDMWWVLKRHKRAFYQQLVFSASVKNLLLWIA